jgi:hypothetical protein
MWRRSVARNRRAAAASRTRTAVLRALMCAGLAGLPVAASGCGPAVDLKQALQVVELSGGYYDEGIVDGRNKLVPMVKFRLTRTGERPRTISLNVHFRKVVGDQLEDFDEIFLQTVDFPEGSRTPVLSVRAKQGYTGDPPQTRAEMLKHSQFVDMRAIVFARQSSSNWVELTRFDVPRQVLTN